MKNKYINCLLLLTWLLASALSLQANTESWDGTEEGEAMARGPVHEAFAQPVPVEAGERYVIATRPPEAIQELPPEEKPAGEQVIWISGYWHYDDEANEFIWISGCWRAVPPGMSWIAGYWQETTEGFEWIAGYWYDNTAGGISYLPEPPASLEYGPSSTTPNEDSIWVPGSWVWQQDAWGQAGRYVWQPGYWLAAQPDRIWVPPYYTYTPHGYVYVGGYWDYALATRGVVFLPMRFSSTVYLRRGFYYSPRLVIGLDLFYNDFFFSLRRRHYYFGDYYSSHYIGLNYYPWFSSRSRVQVYDHLFVYARWTHRRDSRWVQKQRSDYIYRQKHATARPPRVYRPEAPKNAKHQSSWAGRNQSGKMPIRSLKDIAREQGRARFEKLAPQQRQEWSAKNRTETARRQDQERGAGQRTSAQRPGRNQGQRGPTRELSENETGRTAPGTLVPPGRRNRSQPRGETARPDTNANTEKAPQPTPRQQRGFSPAKEHQPRTGSSRPATTSPGSTIGSSMAPRTPEVRPPRTSAPEQRQSSSSGTAGSVSQPSPRPAGRATPSVQLPSSGSVRNNGGGAPRSNFSGRTVSGGGRPSPPTASPASRAAPYAGTQQPALSAPPSIEPQTGAGGIPEREQPSWGGQTSAPSGTYRSPAQTSGGSGRSSRPARSSFSGNRSSGRAGSRRGSR